MHTQVDLCLHVTRWKGDSILVAKGNQPTLADDWRLFFTEPPVDCQDWRTAETKNKGHGRLEIRALTMTTELNDFLAGRWIGVAQVFRLVRTVQKKGKTHQEVIYGITSLSPAQADAQRLLELIRAHWAIENRLHYRRDVTDATKITVKCAREPLPAFWRSLTVSCWPYWISLMFLNVAQQMRIFVTQPLLAVRLLLGSLLTFK